MLPFVHPVVGYVCYAVYARWRGEGPGDGPAGAAILGAALPDLIDKPIWLANLVPVGRTIGHSLLFVIPLSVVAWRYARRRGRDRLGVAFAIGLVSHAAADVPWHLLAGDYRELGFLLWPVTPMPNYSGTKPLGSVAGLEATTLWLEAAILVGGVALWLRDGRPGIALLTDRDG